MNLSDLLNSDVRSLGQLARQGFGWWTGELAGLVPPALCASGRRRALTIAAPTGDGAGYRLQRDGAVLETARGAAEPLRAVELMLPAERVLTRDVELPLLPAADTRRMLAYDLDRLTPFAVETVYFDAEVVERDADRGRQRLRLGVLPRADAQAAVAHAAAFGLSAEVLSAADPQDGAPRFDFLRQMRAGRSGDTRARRRLVWWTAVAALMALNLMVLVLRDMTDVSRLRDTVASQRAAAGLAMRARQRVLDESNARATLVRRQASQEPLRVMNAVTAVLPASAWTDRLEWNGRTVRVTGYAPPGVDVAATLRASPVLANVRALGGDVAAPGAGRLPFDVAADVRATGR